MSTSSPGGAPDALRPLLEQAIQHHRAHRLSEAERLYRAILAQAPRHPDAHHNLGVLAAQARQPAAGLPHLRAALEVNPGHHQYWLSYIDVLLQANQTEEARRTLEAAARQGVPADALRALEARLRPAAADPEARLAALFQQGRFADMAQAARELTETAPQSPAGWKALGTALMQLTRPVEAEAPLRRAAELLPDDGDVQFNLGQSLQAQRRFEQAADHYRRATVIQPADAEAHCNLGIALKEQGRLIDAETAYREALRWRPGFPEALGNLGVLLNEQRRFAEAEPTLRQALAAQPRSAFLHLNLGVTLNGRRQYADAASHFRQALAWDPALIAARNGLGMALDLLGAHTESEVCYREILAREPHNADAWYNLGFSLFAQLRFAEAEAAYRQALASRPTFTQAQSNLIFCLTHDPGTGAEALAAAHRRYGEMVESAASPAISHASTHASARETGRALRVGFVSADFRQHPVAHYFEPILAELARDAGLMLHAYSNSDVEDTTTSRLRAHFHAWRPIAALDDRAAFDAIRADGIDILVDLSGHTTDHRLPLFAMKPAPVQASWIGYPGTTGLCAVDYFLSDALFAPAGFAPQFTEKILRLPAATTFQPFDDAPAINALPARTRGHLTFASFNHVRKLNPAVIALWSRLLNALPDARMLVAAANDAASRALLTRWFGDHGVAPSRLDFHGRMDAAAYLRLHHEADICLDSFPFGGGATTFNALWMGLPTLTLPGETPPSRMGAAIMGHMGLADFVAEDADAFVERGCAWPARLDELADVRAGMRERFQQSSPGQQARVADGAARAFRAIWARWCAAEHPTEMDFSDI